MATPELITALQATPLASYIRGAVVGGEWCFPTIETVHVMAIGTVYGSIAMLDLRMIGFGSRRTSVSSLTHEVLPWTWVAFALAAVSGSFLFIANGETYWNNFQARAKFLCMALAGVNMAVYHFGLHRRPSAWQNTLPTPMAMRVAGTLSIALWTGVVFFGRWIGFTM